MLQPQRDSRKLRTFLRNNGFKIIKEEIAIEGKFYYEILKVIKGSQPHYLDDLLSKDLADTCNEKFIDYVKFSLKNCQNLIDKLSKIPTADKRIQELVSMERIYKEVLNNCESKRCN